MDGVLLSDLASRTYCKITVSMAGDKIKSAQLVRSFLQSHISFHHTRHYMGVKLKRSELQLIVFH